MIETLKLAITGFNVVPTILMGVIVLYWLTMIIGLVDLDLFDFDLDGDLDFDMDADMDVDADIDADVDADADMDAHTGSGSSGGFFQTLLLYVNLDHVPFMVVMSILVFYIWLCAMLINILPFKNGGLIAALLLIPCLPISLFLTKYTTLPLAKVFTKAGATYDKGAKTMGRTCTLLADLPPDRLGQAEIYDSEKHLVINVKTDKNTAFKKGDKAIVVQKDDEKNVYTIAKFKKY